MKSIVLSFSIADSNVTGYYFGVANLLVSQGHRVIVLADKVEPHDFEVDPGIKVLRWPSSRPTRLKDLLFAIGVFLKYRPYAVVSMFGSVNISVLASVLAFVPRRIVWVRTISTAFEANPMLEARKRMLYRLAGEVIANSRATRDDLVSRFGVRPAKIRVFPNALGDSGITSDVDPMKLLYVGRLMREKGVDLLLEALPEVAARFPEVKLTVIGGKLGFGRIRHYEDMAGNLGVAENVLFIGEQPRKKVLMQMAGSYCTLMPSFAEGFGWVVAESLSVGTPVIGSNATAIGEIIRDGRDGFLFEPGNKTDLADKIIRLLSDRQLRAEMSANSRKRFAANYDLDVVAKDVARYLTGSLP